jgi:hypothetical protein
MKNLHLKAPLPELVARAMAEYLPSTKPEDIDEMAVMALADKFDRMGPFSFCKEYNLLVNGSGEEFAVAFMSYFNKNFYIRY